MEGLADMCSGAVNGWPQQAGTSVKIVELQIYNCQGKWGQRTVLYPVAGCRWLMFYEGVGEDGTTAIGLAVSDNGRCSWRRCPRPLLEAAVDGDAWDAGCVGAPCAVAMAYGKWRLYYAGSSHKGPGRWQGIGLALTADDEEEGEFEGIKLSFKRRSAS